MFTRVLQDEKRQKHQFFIKVVLLRKFEHFLFTKFECSICFEIKAMDEEKKIHGRKTHLNDGFGSVVYCCVILGIPLFLVRVSCRGLVMS